MNRFLLILFCIMLSLATKTEIPTVLEARSGPEGAILLKWDGSGDSFVLYRAEKESFQVAEEIARIKGTAYTDYPDTNGNVYYYWVTALSGDTESPPSLPASAVCDREAPLLNIASPSDGARISGTLNIEGTASDGETGVNQVEVRVNGTWYRASGTSTWRLSITSPPQGKVVLCCRAQDMAGNSIESAEITVFVESVPPHIESIQPDEIESDKEYTAEISGNHFVETPQVLVGAIHCSVSFISDTALTVTIPALNPGRYDVTIVNPDGKSDTLESGLLSFEPNSPPVIVDVSAVPQFVPNNGTTTLILSAHVEDSDDNIETVLIDFSPFNGSMTAMKDDGVIPDKVAGDSVYTVQTVISKETPEGTYTLEVVAEDDFGARDTSSVTITVVEDPPDNPPQLVNYQVSPSSGTSTTIFRYTVTYTDQDNNAPTYVSLTITGVGTFNMIESNPDDYNYVDGNQYYYEYSGLGAGTHSYTIAASDGTNPVSIGATGPSVSGTNTAPTLLSLGVTPSSGTQTTNFRYTVTYTDADNDDPASLTITITGIGTFAMSELDPGDTYYKDGKLYYYDYTAGLSPGTHSYTITADDGTDTTSVGGTGPTVTADPNTPATLTSYSVTPSSGTQTTNFRYTVTYTDFDNDDPASLTITITGIGTFAMSELDPGDTYYKDGKLYYYDYTAGLSPGTHSYTITADDGTDTTSVGGTGPTVTADPNTPATLTSYSVTPACGNTSTVFVYQVTYTDTDNDDPVSLTITITGIGTFAMSELDPGDTYYKNGKVYFYVYSGGFPIGTHSYTVTADDGTDTTSVGGTGPEIPVGDCAPPTPPPAPRISIFPIAGPSGIWVTVSGTGFSANEDNIKVTFAGVPVSLTPLGSTVPGTSAGTVKANSTGNFSAKFRVPPSSPGIKQVDASGASTPASSVPNKTFTVLAMPLPPHPPPPSAQPPTDTISPNSIITYPQTNTKHKGTYITVRGTASDNNEVTKVEVSFDNGVTWRAASGTVSWSYRWRLPSDGIYTIRSRAIDDEGNTELVGDAVMIVVDNTPPVVAFDPGLQLKEIESQTSFELKGTALDNDVVRRIEITTDGGDTWQPVEGPVGTWTFSWYPVDGEYTLQARAWDDLGQAGYSEEISVIIDTTPPELYITTPDRSTVTGDSFLITGTAYDLNGIATVEVAVNGEPPQEAQGTESWTYQWIVPTAEGTYTIAVTARDRAGLETSAQIQLIVGQATGRGLLEGLDTRTTLLMVAAGAGVLIAVAAALLFIYMRSS
ncbi:MAG: IPT/TIG domain-containing protein [Theionarchaea archaeon]|nr:IPT/TIG domain-containing protein [Theionarchaea archaeon]